MNRGFIKDIMAQNYQLDNFYDPTKIFIVLSLIKEDGFKEKYSINDIATSVYRFYRSNVSIAKYNLNLVIRNLEKYGVSDISSYVSFSINQWIKEQKNNSFTFNGHVLFLNIDDYTKKSSAIIESVCNTLFAKYYKQKLIPIKSFESCINLDDSELDVFGKCDLIELIFEDIQYCQLCEETNRDNLFVTHILLNSESENINDSINKNNLLLLCKEAAKEYLAGNFLIDEFGRVINIKSKVVNEKMRLSHKFLNEERKKFLKKHCEKQLGGKNNVY